MTDKGRESSGYPEDISADQKEVLISFKKHLSDNNIFSNYYDDWFLLRFCRARKFNLLKIIEMFMKYLEFCRINNVANILETDFSETESVIEKYYEHGLTGISKEGLPVNVERQRKFDSVEIAKLVSIEQWSKYVIRSQEKLMKCIFPYCSKQAGKRIDKQLVIVDLEGMNISPIIFNEEIRRYLQVASQIGQDNYPEIMGQLWVVNAPMIFSVLWSVTKIWLDKKTRDKIKICGSGFKKEQLKVIDADNLPDFLGGNVADHPNNHLPWTDYVNYCYKNKTFAPVENVNMSDPIEIIKFNPLDPQEIDAIKDATPTNKINLFDTLENEEEYFDEATPKRKVSNFEILQEGNMSPQKEYWFAQHRKSTDDSSENREL